MSTEQIYAEFDKWWHAPEQHELRISCAKGWGFRIWQASHNLSDQGFSLERDYLNDQIAYWKLQAKVGTKPQHSGDNKHQDVQTG